MRLADVHLTGTQFVQKLWWLLGGSARSDRSSLRRSEPSNVCRFRSVDRTVWDGGLKDTIQKWDPPCDNVPVTDSIRQTKSRPLSGCPMGHSEKTRLAVKGRVCGFEVAIHLPRSIESTKILNEIRKRSVCCPKPWLPPAVPGTHFEKIE